MGSSQSWDPSDIDIEKFKIGDGLSSRHVMQCLEALRTEAADLHAVVALDVEQAFANAARLDDLAAAGHTCGPLHGTTVVVKDNIDVAGLPTTNGSAAHDGRPAVTDADVVKRLRLAGVIVLGKTNMDELALGATSSNGRFPRAVNAWQNDRIPGGSSGGSAVALASGVASGALGTDTGGSVRTPAAFNGVVGLRPTLGALSTKGVLSLSPMFDTVGPMGRSVEVVRQLFAGMAEPSLMPEITKLTHYPSFDRAAPLHGLRIGVLERHFMELATTEVAGAVMAALDVFRQLGASPMELEIPGVQSTQQSMSRIMLRDAFATYRDSIEDKASLVHPLVRQRVFLGRDVSEVDYAEAVRERTRWRSSVMVAFDSVDMLIAPTTPAIAPRIEQGRDELEQVLNVTQFTAPWSLAGVPAVSVPCGMSSAMPVGMQLVGPRGSDEALLRIASIYEHATLWNYEFDKVRNKKVEPMTAKSPGGTS